MELMTSPRMLYRWGRWVWYYRALAVLTYVTVVLAFLGFGDVIGDLIQTPTAVNLLLGALIVLLLAACGLWVWSTWRQGQMRAAQIFLSPEQNMLLVKTLNFTTRRIPIAAIKQAEYSATQYYATPDYYGDQQVYEPTLMVEVDHVIPIRIDMQGHILDADMFSIIFPYKVRKAKPAQRRKGRAVPAKR